MEKKIIVKKIHDTINDNYIDDPEKSLDIVEQLRLEAEEFIYEKPVTFQRVIKIIRRK